ncbi:hypothetical protein [Paraburkholderia terrae]
MNTMIHSVFAFGLLATTPVFAGGHYQEVWNPPEARGSNVGHVHPAYRAPVRRHVSAHSDRHHTHRHVVAATPALETRVATAPRSSSHLSFGDIPRQITPEGNVLRVDGGRARAEIER